MGERGELEGEYQALREDGFAVEWRGELPETLRSRFYGAVFHSGSLQPARWVRRLAALAAEAGADLREGERIVSLDELEAEHVVIATDGYTDSLVPTLTQAIRPTRGQVVATEPLDRLLFPCPHYTRHGYHYWQQTPDRRLVLGGLRDTALEEEFTSEEAITPLIQRGLAELAPRSSAGRR